MQIVTIIGGGLAGSEAALLLAAGGIRVVLIEQKPARRSPAHRTDGLAELVCSNSLRSDDPAAPAGLLKAELRRARSLVIEAAVPGGHLINVATIEDYPGFPEGIMGPALMVRDICKVLGLKHKMPRLGPVEMNHSSVGP